LAVVVVTVTVTAFVINMVFDGHKQVRIRTELPGIEFSATGVRGFSNKMKALESARTIRSNGGAGFVDFDGEWFVIEVIGEGDMRFSAEPIEVSLASTEHKELFDALIQSFAENITVLQSLSEKSAREVSVESLRLYNELYLVVHEFDALEGTNTALYSCVTVAVNKQLLALFLLSTEKNGGNATSALEYCICAISFAYIELLTSLRSL